MDGTGAVKNGEVVVLELQSPARKKNVRVLHLLEPLHRGMVCYYGKGNLLEERAEVHDG